MFTKRTIFAATGLCLVYGALGLPGIAQAAPKNPKKHDDKKPVATATFAAPSNRTGDKKKKDEKKAPPAISQARHFATPATLKPKQKKDEKKAPPSQAQR
jgi:hypothetical protein